MRIPALYMDEERRQEVTDAMLMDALTPEEGLVNFTCATTFPFLTLPYYYLYLYLYLFVGGDPIADPARYRALFMDDARSRGCGFAEGEGYVNAVLHANKSEIVRLLSYFLYSNILH